MEEKICINEYVRTNIEGIGKVINLRGYRVYLDNEKDVHITNIIDHNYDIIKLIQVGDIIEWEWKEFGYYGINEVINRFGTIGVYPEEYDEVISLKDIKIKSILTHEQYERDCYRLEDN